ncbi:hypothetical protein BKA70DRAFT_485925 [Coprinopsis sp. MPI-PUGE-AT-0042]|nr:hypothetical protein BKA70DRAFT_1330412 [Coprinopsis sp. MPI-PUGE-AT-0042]KAH6916406.1 hypothetical protein BKA70DRAFT_485925 [Coprinopsis sp. MPI-PUGE-AT-0042]
MRRRNNLLAFVGLFLFLHLSFLAFRRHLEAAAQEPLQHEPHKDETQQPQHGVDPPAVKQEPPPKPRSKWCQYNDCLSGRWVPRDPPFANLQEFQDQFSSRGSSPWHECQIQDESLSKGKSPDEVEAMKTQRLLNVINYVWKPNHGKQVPWDAEDFVVRLLKTPAGISFLGDSVSAGWEHAFGSLLEQGVSAEKGGIPFDMITAYVHGEAAPGIRPHILRPNHPKTLELQRRAGVPDSRMKRPVFQIIEEHMLLQPPVIRNITESHGAEKNFTWYLDMKRIPGWEDYLQNLTTPKPGEEDTVTDDSLVVMNTGAHWSRGTLHMLPNRETVEAEHQVLEEVYQDMMQIVIERMNRLRQVKIFYRTTSPAHPACGAKTRPYRNVALAIQAESDLVKQVADWSTNAGERKMRLRWDWDRFDVHNDLWREEVPRLQHKRRALEAGGTAKADLPPHWLFVDYWEMALQRPDAHSDCLHWCLPAMKNEWSQHLYHLLHLESGLQ